MESLFAHSIIATRNSMLSSRVLHSERCQSNCHHHAVYCSLFVLTLFWWLNEQLTAVTAGVRLSGLRSCMKHAVRQQTWVLLRKWESQIHCLRICAAWILSLWTLNLCATIAVRIYAVWTLSLRHWARNSSSVYMSIDRYLQAIVLVNLFEMLKRIYRYHR